MEGGAVGGEGLGFWSFGVFEMIGSGVPVFGVCI